MDEHIRQLTNRYLRGECTEAEISELEAWYANLGSKKPDPLPAGSPEAEARLDALFDRLKASIGQPQMDRHGTGKETPVRHLFPLRWVAAAVLLVLLGAGSYFLYNHKSAPSVAIAEDILPGGNHAVLTLANGQKIVLDSIGNGQVATQGGVQVIKLDSGQLAYKGNGAAVAYNTLSTPRGGQYRITLPDGSKVWLNAASSLKFPTAFNGVDRHIELTGEAYFEVVHDAAKPFKVSSQGQTVTVLGTHFDVEAYVDNKGLRTSLYQGKVEVQTTAGKKAMLSPGNQSIATSNKLSVEAPENMEDAIAWKEGLISFSASDIPDLLRQLERWYDIEVRYNGAPPDWKLSGKISKYTHLSGVVKILNLSGLTCHVEGRTLIVD